MGRPGQGKSGRKQRRHSHSDKNMGMKPEDFVDDIDAFHKKRDKISLDPVKDIADSDELEEDEVPVMDLKGVSEESDNDEDEKSDDDEMGEEELTGLEAKMLRQAKIMKQKAGIVNEDDEEEEEEKEKAAWGKGKKIYYNADNVDYELLSSDEEAPAEEEAEVLRLQQQVAASLRPEDYEVDADESSESEPDEDKGNQEETLEEAVRRQEGKTEKKKSLKAAVKGRGKIPEKNIGTVAVEEVKKDMSALSKEELMEVVMSDAPELVALLTELREGLDELRTKVEPLLEKVKEGQYATKEGISYLEVKHLLLLSYCQSIVFYLLLKAEARSVRDHPVIARLVELKMFLEKIRPIDKKLQYQIEKLLKAGRTPAMVGANEVREREDALMYRPNPSLLVSKLDQMAEDGGGVYRPPMIAPAVMEEEENSRDKRSKARAEKEVQRRASRSAYIKELANELEGKPEEVREVLGTESKEMIRERARLEARAQEEEELFARVPLSRAERKKVKDLKRSRNGLMGMLDDFEDDVGDLVGMDDIRPAKIMGSLPEDPSKPRTLSQLIAEAGKPFKKPKIVSGDADLPVREELGERRRKHEMQRAAKAPVMADEKGSDGDSEDVEPEEDQFYQEAKQLKEAKKAAKAAKYDRNPIIPAVDDDDDVEGKRHISRQMEKNTGLTRHRKKLTKNPRKKYKLKHEKAVIRRKGQVREVRTPTTSYGGEATGIRTNISRSTRFKQ